MIVTPRPTILETADGVLGELKNLEQLMLKLDERVRAMEGASATAVSIKARDLGASFGPPSTKPALYLVDKTGLDVSTSGISYRSTKDMAQKIPDVPCARWGSVVQGIDQGDGWLQVGDNYLPMIVYGVPVLKPNLYLVDNTQLRADTHGLHHRVAKDLEARHEHMESIAHWGTLVSGEDHGAWVKSGEIYLPKHIDGKQVMAAGADGLWVIDNSKLEADTAGLHFRTAKSLDARSEDPHHIALWQSMTSGVDQGDGWLKVGDFYLPMVLSDVPVIIPFTGTTSQAKPPKTSECFGGIC